MKLFATIAFTSLSLGSGNKFHCAVEASYRTHTPPSSKTASLQAAAHGGPVSAQLIVAG